MLALLLQSPSPFRVVPLACQTPVRFFALPRIEPHPPPLVRAPVNSFEFFLRPYSPGGALIALATAETTSEPPLLSAHRLGPGLPGYLIPFATLAFAPQRQLRSRESLSPPAFLLISTHFTAPPRVPLSPPALQVRSIQWHSPVEPGAFTSD